MNGFLRCVSAIAVVTVTVSGCSRHATTWFDDNLTFADNGQYFFAFRTDRTVTEPYFLDGHRGERSVSSTIKLYAVNDLSAPKLRLASTLDCHVTKVCDDEPALRKALMVKVGSSVPAIDISAQVGKAAPKKFECNDPLFITCGKPVLPSTDLTGRYVRILSEPAGTSAVVFDENGKIIRTQSIRLVP